MSRRLLLLIGLAAAGVPARAAAETCRPAIELAGDAALVAEVSEILGARGVSLSVEQCGAIRAHVDRRGNAIGIVIDQPDGTQLERVVGETKTAATVIESFVRMDVGDPLLATRALPSEPPSPIRDRVDPPDPAPQMLRAARGVHLLSAFEGSYASDHTSWIGAHIGVCVMFGPVCGAARLRFASVADGPGVWKEQLERRSTELLFGIDVPFAVGTLTLSPGFAAGLGQMHTRGEMKEMRAETGGVRADVHVTLTIPLWRRLAIDVFSAADLTQETRVEWDASIAPLPDEPRLLVRFGIGLRYGGL